MQAIITKYLGPTNTRGARIRATIHNNFSNKSESLTIPFDAADSDRTNHATAAMMLARKLICNDVNPWQCGELPNGGYVFVMQGEAFSMYFNQHTRT